MFSFAKIVSTWAAVSLPAIHSKSTATSGRYYTSVTFAPTSNGFESKHTRGTKAQQKFVRRKLSPFQSDRNQFEHVPRVR